MSVLDIDALAAPLEGDNPCGENLEYDPLFSEMERSAEGRAERSVGDSVIEGEDADWRTVHSRCLSLFERTRDLRVGVYLARALVHTAGWPGLGDAIELLRRLIDEHWDQVHPELDAEDDNDPTMRLNALQTLCDPETVLASISRAALVSSRGLGRFSLRDLDIASGRIELAANSELKPPEMGAIDAAFLDCDLQELQATEDALALAIASAKALEESLASRVGSSAAPNLAAFYEELARARGIVADRLARRGAGTQSDTVDDETVATSAPGSGGKTMSGTPGSRADVISMIDQICQYYAAHEPSSPVPLLLRRAKRLVSKDFLEILRDMAPDGVGQAELISGTQDD